MNSFPVKIPNWIGAQEQPTERDEWFDKLNPANGKFLCKAARSRQADVERAVALAKKAQPAWADTPAVQRGLILHKIVTEMQKRQSEIAAIVAAETGKSMKEALGETGGAIQCGLFYASEGQRLYGRTTTSGAANKYAMTIRQPIGVAGLIIAANTPIANVAWKVFPALICGNAAVLKAAEDTPATVWIFAQIAKEAGLPDGVLSVVQGFGEEAGAPLVAHADVDVISFTGSTDVGRVINRVAAERFARISLELGGKNPLVVCDDADLENAAKWVLLSAFSNAGQRCASTSRVIIFEAIYEKFRDLLAEKTQRLKVGTADDCDLGAVINEGQLLNMLAAVEKAEQNGATILCGGKRLTDAEHKDGYYMAPTLIENVNPHDEISECELFGPVALLFKAKDFEQALQMANDTPYGLTASIHTRSIHRAVRFYDKVQTGVAVVNAGTHGSEPHMPFGGRKLSGNGSREPGTEALDVYSELKDVYVNIDPMQV
ncbi:MAG: aldehyde dehydrogenase family protein [Anaerolineales bacterium]|nr:aldehyde dehydrogenase family protein [Anaerolineales bacterium]